MKAQDFDKIENYIKKITMKQIEHYIQWQLGKFTLKKRKETKHTFTKINPK